MAYTNKDVIFIARNERKTIANILVYLKPKKEFVVCSNLTQKGEEIIWDWGHYYLDFKTAISKLYEYEIEDLKLEIKNIVTDTIKDTVNKIDTIQHTMMLYDTEEEIRQAIEKCFDKLKFD